MTDLKQRLEAHRKEALYLAEELENANDDDLVHDLNDIAEKIKLDYIEFGGASEFISAAEEAAECDTY